MPQIVKAKVFQLRPLHRFKPRRIANAPTNRLRVTSIATTVADCFTFRSKVGLDVALEVLREAWRARRFTMDELDRFAAICRVRRVMRPYLEALVA